ncbi:S1C family serine protease [Demequina sediminicola]|uniref:S1C family serine protease n=1 Tax=Demequina sediminicola TaxID=1095026 RepID=UPI0007839CC1|nr:trypsin-like peptidase domain-containing protein [Demequina sediminicola]
MSDNPFASPSDPEGKRPDVNADHDSAESTTPPSAASPVADAVPPTPPTGAPAGPQYDTEKLEYPIQQQPAPQQQAAAERPTATPYGAAHQVPAQSAMAPHDPAAVRPDGTFSTAAPAYDGAAYGTPPSDPAAGAKPAKEKRGKVGKGAVAGITAGALLLGLGGGVLGSWAWDEYGDGAEATIATATSEPVDRPEGSVAAVAAEVMPSTVSIEASISSVGGSTGSGFVIREDGYIMTNNHVVEGADDITVIFSDGSEYPADLVGATSDYDLAVLQVDLEGLTPLAFADSDEVVVGDDAIAVGSPLGLQATVTTGIVSAMHRPVTAGDNTDGFAFIDAIQTDAAINPGNSGGPLLNANGEVIGVNSAIATLSDSVDSTGSIGLGFAIPSNQAERTANELIETGEATYPLIGVQLDRRYVGEGVKVVDDAEGVTPGLPAAEAGIEPGDVITAIDGRPITQVDELVVAIRAQSPGDDVVLTVLRDGEQEDITVTLASSATLDAQQG